MQSLRTYNNAQRIADQVSVLEFNTGALLAVVDNNLYASLVQLFVDFLSLRQRSLVLHVYRNNEHLIRSNSYRPDHAVSVMALLNAGSHSTANADTVAAHNHRLLLAVFVQICCAHSSAVFGVQLEHLTCFNAASLSNRSAAMRAGIALSHQADISNIGRGEVTARVSVDVVIALMVSTAANIVHIHNGCIANDDNLLRIHTNRAHVAANGTSLC